MILNLGFKLSYKKPVCFMFNVLFKTAINNVYNETHMKPEDINSVTLKILLKGYLIPKEFILKKFMKYF